MNNEQPRNEFENMQLGEIALKLGYITRYELDSLLHELELSKNTGVKFLIGEILIQKKLLNKKQLKHILSLQKRIQLNCELCRKRFSIKNYDSSRDYKCPHCSNPLILPKSDSQRVKTKKKKQLENQANENAQNPEQPSQDGDLLISSNIADIARQAFSMTEEPFSRYSEFIDRTTG